MKYLGNADEMMTSESQVALTSPRPIAEIARLRSGTRGGLIVGYCQLSTLHEKSDVSS